MRVARLVQLSVLVKLVYHLLFILVLFILWHGWFLAVRTFQLINHGLKLIIIKRYFNIVAVNE